MRQTTIYIFVGSAAALTHLATVAFLVEVLFAGPLTANLIGFCLAFSVSFKGHSQWTFPTAPERRPAARLRFFAVALIGFLLNQSAYAFALPLFGARFYLPVLAAVLLGVASVTFLLSKLWAFAHPENNSGVFPAPHARIDR
jgi:putative flippase GtrA